MERGSAFHEGRGFGRDWDANGTPTGKGTCWIYPRKNKVINETVAHINEIFHLSMKIKLYPRKPITYRPFDKIPHISTY